MKRASREQHPDEQNERWALDVYETLYEEFSRKKRRLRRRGETLLLEDQDKSSKLAISLDQGAREIRSVLMFNTRQMLNEVLEALMPMLAQTAVQHQLLGGHPPDTPVGGVATITDMGDTTIYFQDARAGENSQKEYFTVHIIDVAHTRYPARKYVSEFLPAYINSADELTN